MRALACSVLLFLAFDACAQSDSAHYRIRPWVDVPICVGSSVAIITGLNAQDQSDPLTPQELASLDPARIPGFDRGALRIDPSGQDDALTISDRILNTSAAAPLLLLIDRRVRHEWLPVLTLYVEAATITGGIQTWGSVAVKRYRPIAYIPTATEGQRTDARNMRSFYSGHTANAAVATFFMAKVLDDLHPELGGRRWWLYGAAVVPPALVGWYRVQGGKHFPSDVVVGGVLGAAAGVLVPELHRRLGNEHLGIVPLVAPELLGMHLSLQW